jgi:hypothetical protein
LWQVVPGTGKVREIEVRTGQSDMAFTEIISGDIKDGDPVVIGQARQMPAASSDTTNPLGPPRFRGRSAAKNPG